MLEFKPLSPVNWTQYESLMGEKGGCGGCWCMTFRLPKKEFEANKYDGNKQLMKQLVDSGKPAGLIATKNNEPVGWIAFAPREHYLKIEKSRAFTRIDEKAVWSVTCFFVKKEYRHKGFSKLLIKGVIDYARQHHIKTLEAYPAIPYSPKVSPPFLWVGILSAFTDNGFTIVQQNGKSRAMVRLDL